MWNPTIPPPPIYVTVYQKFGWLPSVLSFIQFIGLAVLSVYTFHTNRSDKSEELTNAAADKIRERKALWFHKMVVDEALKTIPEFTQTFLLKLQQAALEHMKGSAAQLAKDDLDEKISQAINDFQVSLSQTISLVVARVKVLDPELAKKLLETSDEYEKQVSTWIGSFVAEPSAENLQSLPELITQGEIKVLRLLFDFEFVEFPKKFQSI